MTSDPRCAITECSRIPTKRGLCSTHYSNVRAADVKQVHADWDAVRLAVDYRLALAQAHARVTQMALVLEHPNVSFGVDLRTLLRDVEQILRGVIVVQDEAWPPVRATA